MENDGNGLLDILAKMLKGCFIRFKFWMGQVLSAPYQHLGSEQAWKLENPLSPNCQKNLLVFKQIKYPNSKGVSKGQHFFTLLRMLLLRALGYTQPNVVVIKCLSFFFTRMLLWNSECRTADSASAPSAATSRMAITTSLWEIPALLKVMCPSLGQVAWGMAQISHGYEVLRLERLWSASRLEKNWDFGGFNDQMIRGSAVSSHQSSTQGPRRARRVSAWVGYFDSLKMLLDPMQ